MISSKARIRIHEDEETVVPILIPDLEEVRQFAARLHAAGDEWNGEYAGWQAEYHPERSQPPFESSLKFTPADFCIGDSDVWFFSLMWEHGKDSAPVEFLDDRHLVKS